MEDKINKLKQLFNLGINNFTYNELINNCTNGTGFNRFTAYINDYTIEEWIELYNQSRIKVTKEQLLFFFEYQSNVFPKYFIKEIDLKGNNIKFKVTRGFFIEKSRIDFSFECIVLTSFEVYTRD